MGILKDTLNNMSKNKSEEHTDNTTSSSLMQLPSEDELKEQQKNAYYDSTNKKQRAELQNQAKESEKQQDKIQSDLIFTLEDKINSAQPNDTFDKKKRQWKSVGTDKKFQSLTDALNNADEKFSYDTMITREEDEEKRLLFSQDLKSVRDNLSPSMRSNLDIVQLRDQVNQEEATKKVLVAREISDELNTEFGTVIENLDHFNKILNNDEDATIDDTFKEIKNTYELINNDIREDYLENYQSSYVGIANRGTIGTNYTLSNEDLKNSDLPSWYVNVSDSIQRAKSNLIMGISELPQMITRMVANKKSFTEGEEYYYRGKFATPDKEDIKPDLNKKPSTVKKKQDDNLVQQYAQEATEFIADFQNGISKQKPPKRPDKYDYWGKEYVKTTNNMVFQQMLPILPATYLGGIPGMLVKNSKTAIATARMFAAPFVAGNHITETQRTNLKNDVAQQKGVKPSELDQETKDQIDNYGDSMWLTNVLATGIPMGIGLGAGTTTNPFLKAGARSLAFLSGTTSDATQEIKSRAKLVEHGFLKPEDTIFNDQNFVASMSDVIFKGEGSKRDRKAVLMSLALSGIFSVAPSKLLDPNKPRKTAMVRKVQKAIAQKKYGKGIVYDQNGVERPPDNQERIEEINQLANALEEGDTARRVSDAKANLYEFFNEVQQGKHGDEVKQTLEPYMDDPQKLFDEFNINNYRDMKEFLGKTKSADINADVLDIQTQIELVKRKLRKDVDSSAVYSKLEDARAESDDSIIFKDFEKTGGSNVFKANHIFEDILGFTRKTEKKAGKNFIKNIHKLDDSLMRLEKIFGHDYNLIDTQAGKKIAKDLILKSRNFDPDAVVDTLIDNYIDNVIRPDDESVSNYQKLKSELKQAQEILKQQGIEVAPTLEGSNVKNEVIQGYKNLIHVYLDDKLSLGKMQWNNQFFKALPKNLRKSLTQFGKIAEATRGLKTQISQIYNDRAFKEYTNMEFLKSREGAKPIEGGAGATLSFEQAYKNPIVRKNENNSDLVKGVIESLDGIPKHLKSGTLKRLGLQPERSAVGVLEDLFNMVDDHVIRPIDQTLSEKGLVGEQELHGIANTRAFYSQLRKLLDRVRNRTEQGEAAQATQDVRLDELTRDELNEIQAITESFKDAQKSGYLKNLKRIAKEVRDKGNQSLKDLNSSLSFNKKVLAESNMNKSTAERMLNNAKSFAKGIASYNMNPWAVLKMYSNGLYDVFQKMRVQAEDRHATVKQAINQIKEKTYYEDLDPVALAEEEVDFEGIDITSEEVTNIRLDKNEVLALYMVLQQPEGWTHLTDPQSRTSIEKYIGAKKERGEFRFTNEQASEVLKYVQNDKDLMRHANFLRESLDMLAAYMNETSLATEGFKIATYENYFPLPANDQQIKRLMANELEAIEASSANQETYQSLLSRSISQVSNNVFAHRSGSGKSGLRLTGAYEMFNEVLQKGLDYAGYHEFSQKANGVLNYSQPNGQSVVYSKLHQVAGESTAEHMKKIADVDFAFKQDRMSKIVRKANLVTSSAWLASSASVPAYQLTALVSSYYKWDGKHVGGAMSKAMSNLFSGRLNEKIKQWRGINDSLVERILGGKVTYQLGELKQTSSKTSYVSNSIDFFSTPIKHVDAAVSLSLWEESIEWARENTDFNTKDELFDNAKQQYLDVMSETQAYFSKGNRTILASHKNEFLRMLGLFTGETSQIHSVFADGIREFVQNGNKKALWKASLVNLFNMSFVSTTRASIRAGVISKLRSLSGRDTDDQRDFWWRWNFSMMNGFLSTGLGVPYFGKFVSGFLYNNMHMLPIEGAAQRMFWISDDLTEAIDNPNASNLSEAAEAVGRYFSRNIYGGAEYYDISLSLISLVAGEETGNMFKSQGEINVDDSSMFNESSSSSNDMFNNEYEINVNDKRMFE